MKIWGYMEIVGETLMIIAVALWITHAAWVPYLFAAAVVIFSVGRLAQGNDSILAETPQENQLRVVRLLRQRSFAIVFLFITAAFMFADTPMHIYQDIFILKSSWLVPFICFSVIEVYTAFRLPQLTKK